MNEDLCCEIEQFLYREARLLDERRFRDWLALFTEDARYWTTGQRPSKVTVYCNFIVYRTAAKPNRTFTSVRERTVCNGSTVH